MVWSHDNSANEIHYYPVPNFSCVVITLPPVLTAESAVSSILLSSPSPSSTLSVWWVWPIQSRDTVITPGVQRLESEDDYDEHKLRVGNAGP